MRLEPPFSPHKHASSGWGKAPLGVMNTLEEWMNKVCAELEIPAGM